MWPNYYLLYKRLNNINNDNNSNNDNNKNNNNNNIGIRTNAVNVKVEERERLAIRRMCKANDETFVHLVSKAVSECKAQRHDQVAGCFIWTSVKGMASSLLNDGMNIKAQGVVGTDDTALGLYQLNGPYYGTSCYCRNSGRSKI